MIKRPRLTRWEAIWAAGCVAVALSIGLAAGTPIYEFTGPALMGAVALLSISDWRTQGHPWFPTLSWALPLAGLWVVIHWVVGYRGGTIFWLGAVSYCPMLFSTRAASWWYEFVLRRPFKT